MVSMFRTYSIEAATVNEAPASSQVSPVQQTSITASGISTLPDTLESPVSSSNYSQNLFAGAIDNSVATGPLTPFEDIPADSAGGVESTLFDKSKFWMIDGALTQGGQIQWDIVSALKTYTITGKGNVDEMLNSLMQMDGKDFAATMKALAENGKYSDLSRLLVKMIDDGYGNRIGDLAVKLGESLPATDLQETFGQLLSLMNPTAMIDFLTKVKGEGVLPHLNRDNITEIYDALMDPASVSGSLYLNSLSQEIGIEPNHDPNVIWGIPSPESLLADNRTDIVSDVNIARAFAAFPDRAISMLKSIEASQPGFIENFIGNLSANGQDLGPFLAELVKRHDTADSVLTQILKAMTSKGQALFGTAVNRSQFHGQDILSMISSLGDNAVNLLSQISPLRLIEMKAILEVKNTPESLAAIKNVIEPALEKATR